MDISRRLLNAQNARLLGWLKSAACWLLLSQSDVADRDFYYGSGCDKCSNIGYHGRKGIYEYLTMTPALRELINERQPTLILRDKAVEQGMRTMRQDGVRNILDGYTTVEEVVKYT